MFRWLTNRLWNWLKNLESPEELEWTWFMGQETYMPRPIRFTHNMTDDLELEAMVDLMMEKLASLRK